ncbi:MAG: sugar ABC transporter ATP-binding protein [Treponemataceae bacterium]
MNTILELKNINKFFLHSQALNNVNLSMEEGECLGIVGHNGAGKSTLVNIVTGTFGQTSGDFYLDGVAQDASYDVLAANRKGIRVVFQELSLCPNLTVIENMRIFHPSLKGWGWRQRAEKTIMETLDEIFPDHGIKPNAVVEDYSLGDKQIVEIAKAFTVVDNPLRLIILDEPTSALDHHRSEQLTRFLKTLPAKKISCIYISHLLDEVVACTSRIAVMKDGVHVAGLATVDATRQKIIELMGEARPKMVKDGSNGSDGEGHATGVTGASFEKVPLVIEVKNPSEEKRISVHEGEVIGLTGLAGHGQTKLLIELFDYKKNKDYKIRGPVTFIPGDRQNDGVFSQWSITKNTTLQVYKEMKGAFLINPKKEDIVADNWRKTIDIKTDSLKTNILSLSGGNQQKVLFARCLESASPIVLMDDPTRGVDVGTKEEIYKLIIEEKRKGRSFVWYTTEMEELRYCDSIYVFKAGKILAKLAGDKVTEQEILKASF